jgi:hypothetical protein
MKSPALSVQTQNRLLLGWAVVISLLLVQRPLFAPNLWWHLAQGRAVLNGSLTPSRQLLTLETANDADWLGGAPWYLAWIWGGNDALSAVPVISALSVFAFVFALTKPHRRAAIVLVVIPLSIICFRDTLQPVPQWFDLLGLLALWLLLKAQVSPRRREALTFVTFAVWGNLGPRPVWGLLLLIATPVAASVKPLSVPTSSRQSKGKRDAADPSGVSHLIRLLVMALVGGAITPRGIWTWLDASILFAPHAFADLTAFGDSVGRIGFDLTTTWTAAEWALLVLWCGWTASKWLVPQPWATDSPHESCPPRYLTEGIPLLAALLCYDNISLAGLWILLDLLQQNSPSSNVACLSQPRWWQSGQIAAAAAILGISVLDAWGWGPVPSHRFGWGIAYELTPGLLDTRLLENRDSQITGWAPDGRSVGIITWLDRRAVMADHPQRALLAGRTAQHVALIDDFLGAHRAQYRRDDGSWGGWMPQLSRWNIEQLFVPAENQRLNLALLTTTWKPVDLDSPTIPFVSAHDSRFAAAVVEVLQQRGFVEAGPWKPTAELYATPGWRWDFVEALGGGPDPAPAILQSKLFRSLDIPMASLRALLPLRQQTRHWTLDAEFETCQRELAYQEWKQFGECTEWMQRVIRSLNHPRHRDQSSPWLTMIPNEEEAAWSPCLEEYRTGDLIEAISALPTALTPQQRYAAAMLRVELGDSVLALKELDTLLEITTDPGIVVAAKGWRQLLEPFAKRSKGE